MDLIKVQAAYKSKQLEEVLTQIPKLKCPLRIIPFKNEKISVTNNEKLKSSTFQKESVDEDPSKEVHFEDFLDSSGIVKDKLSYPSWK